MTPCTPKGFTQLHTATLYGHVEVCKVLISYSAAINSRDSKGMCPLHYAAWGGHLAAVKLLLTGRIEMVRSIIDGKALNGETPLHQAARNGHAKVVTMILQYGGDCTVRNAEQMMAVDLAAQFGRAVVVNALLSFRPDIVTLSETSAYNHTPLHLAARNGHAGLVEMLLDRGHALNASTSNGSALHEAAVAGKHDVVSLLIQKSIDRTILNSKNQTAAEALDEVQGSKVIRKILWQAEDTLLALRSAHRQIFTDDGRVQATVVSDYTPGVFDKDSMQLYLDEIITVTNLSGNEWWVGEAVSAGDNRKGKFPRAFVELGASTVGAAAAAVAAVAVPAGGMAVDGLVLGAGVTQQPAPAGGGGDTVASGGSNADAGGSGSSVSPPKSHNPFLDGDFDSEEEEEEDSDLDADVDSIADALFSGLLGGGGDAPEGGGGGVGGSSGGNGDDSFDADTSALSDDVLRSIPGGRLPVAYLGSVAAKDTTSQSKLEAQLRAAMLKMSSSTKQREIMLGISKSSLKFIDIATGAANVDHPTSDALACLASRDHVGVFGYAARSAAGTSKGFCHIFLAAPDKATGYAAAVNRAIELGTMSASNPFL